MSLDDVKRRILTRVDLIQLIGETVKLTPRSDHHAGCCPFHAEKSPSFAVYNDHYYCYGCKVHGDAITFVREREALSFPEALRYLAGKYGIEAPELDQERRFGRGQQDQSLYKMMAEAQSFFEVNLHHELGAEARSYLLERGFTDESIKDFGFGLTPREGYGLVKHLRGKGFREQDMILAAVATTSARDGRAFDFFRSRITLPIRDPQGRVIGFGGRTTDGNPAKYVNSRETPLFDKGHTLFGYDRARRMMRQKGRALVVEGYMDALMLWQHGFPECVACLGTAFTEAHLKLIHHATLEVVLVLDGDAAGQSATLAAVDVAMAVPEMQVFAVELPAGEDPDSFVRKNGREALEALLAKKVRLLDHVLTKRLGAVADFEVPRIVQSEIVPWLARVPHQIDRDYLIERIWVRTGLNKDMLNQQLAGAQSAALAAARAAAAAAKAGARAARAPQAAGQAPGAAAQATVAGATSGPALPPRPTRPLLPHESELLGHIFFSDPGAVDVTALREAARRDFDLEPLHLHLVETLLTTLEQGAAPSAADSATLAMALPDDACALLEQLRKKEGAFNLPDRPSRVALFLTEQRARKVKESLGLLKRRIALLARDPNQKDELNRTMAEYMSLQKAATAGGKKPVESGR